MKFTWKLVLALALGAGIACGSVRAETEPEPDAAAAPAPMPAPSPAPAPDPQLGTPGSAPAPAAPAEPPRALTPAPPVTDPCLAIVSLVIDKSEHRLVAICANGSVKSFRVALGQLPLGYKREVHDLRTPEGFYRIAEAPRGSRFHVFMLLDYPSLADADRALSNGDISPRTYLRIARAVARGDVPPQDTLLGGMIGIHGEGADHQGDSSRRDWTFGCIALSDADAEYLAFRVDVGTPVKIEP
jgi:hypothetical protein